MPRLYGTDWGSYLYYDQRIQFDWDILVNAGCKFFITRGDQEQISANGNYSTVRNIAAARTAGVPVVGSYYWHYPHLQQGYWIDRYIKAIAREHPDVIAVDAEQTSYIGDDGKSYPVDKARAAATLIELCSALRKAYPDIPFLLYSRRDYLLNYAAAALDYINTCDLWLAGWPDYGLNVYEQNLADTISGKMRAVTNYAYTPLPWVTIDANNWTAPTVGTAKTLIWQHSSRIIPTYAGKTTPAYHQYDHNLWLGSEAELYAWAKVEGTATPPPQPPPVVIEQEESTMAKIPVFETMQKDRAKVLFLDNTQRLSGVTFGDLGIDLLIMPIGGMVYRDGKCTVEAEATFKARFKQATAAKIPVIGRFIVDAGAWLKGQETKYATGLAGEGEIAVPLLQNKIFKGLIDSWHDGPWTFESVLDKRGNWLDIKAIEIYQLEDVGYLGQEVTDLWQRFILEATLNLIAYLQDNDNAPKIPVIIYTHKWFVQKYPQHYAGIDGILAQRRGKLWLHLRDDILKSTATFENLEAIFAYRPEDEFKFSYMLPDFDNRVILHEYSYKMQKARTVVDAQGVPSPLNLSLFWSNVRDMKIMFGIESLPEQPPEPEEPPVIPPGEEATTLEGITARVIKLEKIIAAFKAALG